jgi:N-acetylglucosaminyldiphosphoundecaprenol N-acetyl-beta-D-mannosaminyltransferase
VSINDIGAAALIAEARKILEPRPANKFEADLLVQKARLNLKYLDECLNNKRINVLGIGVDNMTMDEAVRKIEGLIKTGSRSLVVTPNPEIIMAAQNDMELKQLVNGAALAPADGVGLMIAGRILRRKFKERIPGIDLLLHIAAVSKEKGYRLFLLGGKEGVAETAAEKLNANVVGTFHGFSKNDRLAIDAINAARPDILFIGMGSPRQEKWAARHMRDINVPVVMGIGGSLDVISGRVKRAPAFMRRAGFEWLWRLMIEPSRWRRMIVLPRFIMKVVMSKYGK